MGSWRRALVVVAAVVAGSGWLTALVQPVSAAEAAEPAVPQGALSGAPQVDSFSPMFGPAGTVVTIHGTAFADSASVAFDGVASTSVTRVSRSKLTAVVPSGASTGSIAVTTASGTGSSPEAFTVGQVFNVMAYGANGSGTGDNAPAFAAAIAAAQGAGGGIVSVPAGTYTFSTGSPTSIQIDGTVAITLAGAGRDTTKLVETTRRKDLLSIHCDGTTVQDLSFDTDTYSGGHGIGDGANDTTVQRVAVDSGTLTFGIYYPGPPGAKPGNGMYDTGNVINDLVLDDHVKSDGFSFAFQQQASISNVVHTGSRISLYADSFVTITNYHYTPGIAGAEAGWVISTPCDHITITNFVSSGQGGQIRNAPNESRMNSDITINGEQMTGGPSYRLLIGDVTGLLVENSTLDELLISPNLTAQGTVADTTYTKVVKRPQRGGTIDITFS